MNNKRLQYAIELSKSLNFSEAAERLGISQPALSKQISGLEKEIGTELFNRRNSPVTLTAAGEYFFREAQDLYYRQQQLYRSMEDYKEGKNGRMIIGISPFRSLYLLPGICQKVKEKYPGIKIVLNEDGSDLLRRKAAEGKYDFAIANLPVDEAVLDIKPIEKDTLVLAVPKSMLNMIKRFPKGDIEQLDFKDCTNLPFVVVGQTQEMRMLFDRICLEADITPHISMEVVGLATAWAMARAGIGATLLPLQFVKSMNFDNSVELFIPKCDSNIRQPAVITRKGQYIPEYTKYAISLLTGEI